jgi:hypothetical protein
MRAILVLSFFCMLTLHTNAQNRFSSRFSEGSGFFKNQTPSIELKDSTDKTILIFKKDGMGFYDKQFVFKKQNKAVSLIDKVTNTSVGTMSKNFRSFSFSGNDYKLSKKKRKGYNFVIRDTNGNIVSFVKYSIFKDECGIEICNKKDVDILPFVFLTTLNEINNGKAEMYLLNFGVFNDILFSEAR